MRKKNYVYGTLKGKHCVCVCEYQLLNFFYGYKLWNPTVAKKFEKWLLKRVSKQSLYWFEACKSNLFHVKPIRKRNLFEWQYERSKQSILLANSFKHNNFQENATSKESQPASDFYWKGKSKKSRQRAVGKERHKEVGEDVTHVYMWQKMTTCARLHS